MMNEVNEENGIPKYGELPKGLIPIDHERPLSFNQATLWYSRFMLMIRYGLRKHQCPICGGEVHFRFCEVYDDPYMNYIIAGCPDCKITSDACYYPRYNISPIDLANGAMQRAIEEFGRRAKK